MINGNRRWAVAVLGVAGFALVASLVARELSSYGAGPTSQRASLDVGEVAGAGSTPAPVVTPSAKLLLPPTPAIQWEELTFSAEGFQAGETVSLLVDRSGTMEEIGKAEADAEGTVTDAKLQLPSWLESGNHAAKAVGSDSGIEAQGTLHVRAKNLWINLQSYTLRQAGKLGLIAGGFEPGEQVRVYLTRGDATTLESQQPLASMSADESGNTSWTEAEVPVVEPGEYNLWLRGEDAENELKAAVTVEPLQPVLELSPWSGLPGRRFELNAKGFLPDEEVEAFVGGAQSPSATFQADEFGNLWGVGPVSTPLEARSGPMAVTLRGRSSGAEVTADFSVVAPHPWAELSSYSGFAGSPVILHGGGFAAGERVTLHVGSASSPLVAEGAANDEGYYQGLGPAQVPSDATESVTFVVVGASSGAEATAVFNIMQPFVPELPQLPSTRQ